MIPLWPLFKDRLFGDRRAQEDGAFLDTTGVAIASAIAMDIQDGTNESGLFPRDKPFEGMETKS